MPEEIWRPAPGFLNIYVVSNKGRVRNICPPRGNGLVFGFVDRYGYRVVNLSRDGVKLKRKIHRLVCEAFHGPCPAGLECAHLDGNSANNAASNLAWVSHSVNVRQCVAHGTHGGTANLIPGQLRGSLNPSAKLTEEKVRELRQRHLAGESGRKLAREAGITSANMSKMLRGERWAHVTAKGDAP